MPCPCFETGAKWHYVWTRDLSYSLDLGLGYLDPERASNSLLFKTSKVRPELVARQVSPIEVALQDTGSGGSWPVSSDRVVWILAASGLTLNAMAAADAVLVPLQCEFFALEGLTQLMKTIEMVRQSLNPTLEIQGLVLTMYDRRNRLTDQVADDVRSCLRDLVFESVIPRNVRLSEAPSHGLPALIYDHACPGSQAYMKLARELIGRLPERRIAA